jgi:methyl-accepting chemotaxis protein
MSNDLLQLRRHEKDFLLRLDNNYVLRFDQTYQQMSEKLVQLDTLMLALNIDENELNALSQSLDEYTLLFGQLVELQTEIGLTPSSGLLADLNRINGQLQEQSLVHKQPLLQTLWSEVVLTEKRMLLQPNTQSIRHFSRLLEQFSVALQSFSAPQRPSLLALLEQYRLSAQRLTSAVEQMGFTHQKGLRGEFRSKAHQVEAQFNSYITSLLPTIALEEQEVKRNSLLIMGFTALALVLLLIKSFATFHHAFANFVMFFHRCKRKYQRLDERKLGFSEFKSLAALANEMVDAKKETERQLRKMEKQLAALNQQSKSDFSVD